MLRLRHAAAVAWLCAAGCATDANRVPVQRAPLLASLERAGCPLGGCPSYLLELTTDGWLTYRGRKDVAVEGLQNTQLSPADVEAVKALFSGAGFYELEGNFECMEGTNAPTVTLSYHLEGRHKTLVHFHGCSSTPGVEKLTLLEDELDRLFNTARWVK